MFLVFLVSFVHLSAPSICKVSLSKSEKVLESSDWWLYFSPDSSIGSVAESCQGQQSSVLRAAPASRTPGARTGRRELELCVALALGCSSLVDASKWRHVLVLGSFHRGE